MRVLSGVIGSPGFKWVMGTVVLPAAVFVFCLGMKAYIADAAGQSPEFIATVAKVDSLQKQFIELKEVATDHTQQLKQAAAERETNAQVQSRIFEAIKSLGNDVHTIDVTVGRVDQKVDDLKEQVARK